MGRDSACLRARASGLEAARHPVRLGCHGKRGELAGGGQQECGGMARPSLRARPDPGARGAR